MNKGQIKYCLSSEIKHAAAYLEYVWVHGTDGMLQHGVLVLAVKVVKEVYIVQWVLVLHGKVNAVLT